MNYRLVVLDIIRQSPCYGYQIKALLKRDFSSVMDVNNNTIYPLLRGFVRDGLAERTVEPVEGKPDRVVYSITPAGRAELQRMVAELPATSVLQQSNFMIAFRFFRWMTPQERAALLDGREERVHQAIARHRDAEWTNESIVSERLTSLLVGFGEKSLQAELDFISEVRPLVDAPTQSLLEE